jgi:hypothetical protein
MLVIGSGTQSLHLIEPGALELNFYRQHTFIQLELWLKSTGKRILNAVAREWTVLGPIHTYHAVPMPF